MRLTLDEALADDSVALSLGYYIPTGQSNSCGRGIVFMDLFQEGKVDYASLIRVFWYGVHVALEDENTQKYGFVTVIKSADSIQQWDYKVTHAICT